MIINMINKMISKNLRQTLVFILMFLITCLAASSCSKDYSQGTVTFKRPLRSLLTEESIINSVNQFDRDHQNSSKRAITTPHIFFFIIDTVRHDAVNEIDAPELSHFMNQSLSPRIGLGGATATHHSLYSLFYSRPAYERIPMIQQQWLLGSPFLYILKNKLNYQIDALGEKSLFFRSATTAPPSDLLSEESSNQLLFGNLQSLITNFQNDGLPTNQINYYSGSSGDSDRAITDQLINKIRNIDNAVPKLTITYYFSAHDPYSRSSDMPSNRILTPSFNPINSLKPSTFLQGDEVIVVNSYRNAVRSIDRQFGRAIAELKAKNIYDNSIVVVIADHGEILGERGIFGHGGWPVRESSMIPIMIKPVSGVSWNNPSFASLMDVFPTLFDLMGLDYQGDYAHLFFGNSLFSRNVSSSSIVIRPAMHKPTNQFALYNNSYKVYGDFQFTDDNIMESSSFKIKSITDLNDQTLTVGKTFDETVARIEKDFRDILEKMYN